MKSDSVEMRERRRIEEDGGDRRDEREKMEYRELEGDRSWSGTGAGVIDDDQKGKEIGRTPKKKEKKGKKERTRANGRSGHVTRTRHCPLETSTESQWVWSSNGRSLFRPALAVCSIASCCEQSATTEEEW